ncbi:FkbM family methyltransferase [Pelagibius sp.]|uniref:FkbM family methyltransferase n=1 Tax=Pelagibius sp. TaxID=1931238 RepID=UPI00260CBF4A|nr:FkbM family methyltransferase [Pelagibius sp.]
MVQRSVRNLAKAVLPKRVISHLVRQGGSGQAQSSPRFAAPLEGVEETLGCCIAYTENGGFCVPLSSRHRPAARTILQGGVYEPETIAFLTDNCGGGDIVHAGAYFGDFLPALSRACAAGAQVWAFEPNPENFRCADVTCAINGLNNVHLMNSGLGPARARAVMQVRDRTGRALGGSSQVVEEAGGLSDRLTTAVDLVALDDVVPSDRQVSVIQLDVEGFEQQALAGAVKTIARCLPILVLETLPAQSWLAESVLSLGYRMDRKVHGNQVLLPPALADSASGSEAASA